ncbi:MAG: sugar phosphate isomerase/epimerase [Verrucomicrobia bacterium]|nr:sugar phosphate isomerase/epimerase [Verrucomicrobiota bacterium]
MASIDRLSINQYTLRQWTLPELLQGCSSEDVPWVALWRDKVAETGLKETVKLLEGTGLRVSSLCRGGFFPAAGPEQESSNRAENRRAVDEAAALGTDTLVLVCGGVVGRDLDRSRRMVEEGIADLLPFATATGVKLGIEPLHPMFAADRSVIVSLRQANRIVEAFSHPHLGVVIDVYHVWWDPEVYAEVTRVAGHILGFHVNDWIVPLPDVLNGRGMMGDGVIEIERLRAAVERAGYGGPIEVEIFNEQLWRAPGIDALRLVKERFLRFV